MLEVLEGLEGLEVLEVLEGSKVERLAVGQQLRLFCGTVSPFTFHFSLFTFHLLCCSVALLLYRSAALPLLFPQFSIPQSQVLVLYLISKIIIINLPRAPLDTLILFLYTIIFRIGMYGF